MPGSRSSPNSKSIGLSTPRRRSTSAIHLPSDVAFCRTVAPCFTATPLTVTRSRGNTAADDQATLAEARHLLRMGCYP